MKNLRSIIFLLLVSVGTNAFSQQTIVTSGGVATWSGGSSSYSSGQFSNEYHNGTNGSVSQGVQQAFEFSTLSGKEFTQFILEAKLYPNPVVNTLVLSIRNFDLKNLSYQLYDIQGKILKNEIILLEQTVVNLESNSPGIYILKINLNSSELKSFTIIKN